MYVDDERCDVCGKLGTSQAIGPPSVSDERVLVLCSENRAVPGKHFAWLFFLPRRPPSATLARISVEAMASHSQFAKEAQVLRCICVGKGSL
jgi:hypothetical protein